MEGYRASVSHDLPATPDPDETVAAIIFSSGTTRRAAGIMHTHDNLIDTTRMTLDVQKLTENDRYLAIIPNSHIYGRHLSGARSRAQRVRTRIILSL